MKTKKPKKWQRPRPCWCEGYWFPHRLGGGACHHNKNVMNAARIIAKRMGLSKDETLDMLADIAWSNPGMPGTECPF